MLEAGLGAGACAPVILWSRWISPNRRSTLITAVNVSIRTVLGNIRMMGLWGTVIAGLTLVSLTLPPAIIVLFPLLAFASFTAYRDAFGNHDQSAPN